MHSSNHLFSHQKKYKFLILFAISSYFFIIPKLSLGQVVANPDFYSATIGEDLLFEPLINDLNATGIAVVIAPQNGILQPLPGNILRYRPTLGYLGMDSARYRACAGVECDEAMLFFRVFFDTSFIFERSTFLEIPLPLFPDDLGEDNDFFDDLESITEVISPQFGFLIIDEDEEEVVYFPNPGFTGTDSFALRICEEEEPCFFSLTRVQVVDTCNTELCVLPGDTNRDGIVNQDDLVGVGWSYGLTGLPRSMPSIDFDDQPAPDWRTDFGGTNSKFGDTNGDGVVLATDTLAIAQNYRLTASRRLYSPTQLETAPVRAKLSVLSDTALYGDTVIIRISLGTPLNPGVNLYGFSASLSYDVPLTADAKQAVFDFSNTWLRNTGDLVLTLGRIDTTTRRVDFALTRTDRMGITGFGEIVSIKLITEDNVGERPDISLDNMAFTLEEAIVYDGQNQRMKLVHTTFVSEISHELQEATAQPYTEVFPNPAQSSQTVSIRSKRPMQLINIYRSTGECVRSIPQKGSINTTIDLMDLPRGMYILSIYHQSGSAEHNKLLVD